MGSLIRIGNLNVNGLQRYQDDVKNFISMYSLDILCISEAHFNKENYFTMPNYILYHVDHPSERSRGGAAILIAKDIKHHKLDDFQSPQIQACTIQIEADAKPITLSAIYCPPGKKGFKLEMPHFDTYLKSLGQCFIAAGDYNAKHPSWNSRITTPRGRQMFDVILNNSAISLAGRYPTHWPTDTNKLPDIIDFYIAKGINTNYMIVEDTEDGTSDHCMTVLNLSSKVILKTKAEKLYNKTTNWNIFRHELDNALDGRLRLKSDTDVDDALSKFTEAIYKALNLATVTQHPVVRPNINIPMKIKELVKERRSLRKRWHATRNPATKKQLNDITRKLSDENKKYKSESFAAFTESLTPFPDSDYSLYRITKSISRPRVLTPPLMSTDGWARSPFEKATLLASAFEKTFKPHNNAPPDPEIAEFLESPLPVDLPIKPMSPSEIKAVIMKMPGSKAPGNDKITNKVYKEITNKARAVLASIFNALLRLNYFPCAWKSAIIHAIPKPGKDATLPGSYRPISLLPSLSKIFEKLLLKRLILENPTIFPDHQFGFRQGHGAVEQAHRVVQRILSSFEEKQYCGAIFLDAEKAFDSVWTEGLLYKIKVQVPRFFLILKSFLTNRSFAVTQDNKLSGIFPIMAGVPQGSILSPYLYNLYTADLPVPEDTISTHTYADDTCYITSHVDPHIVVIRLQVTMDSLNAWSIKWRIKFNAGKSIFIIFTLRVPRFFNLFLGGVLIPQSFEVKYLGLTMDSRLTWKPHILNKRKQLDLLLYKYGWLLGKYSRLSIQNKLLIYKTIIRPTWMYGCTLWGTTAPANLKIIQVAQNKFLRLISGCHIYCYVNIIHRSADIEFVAEVVGRLATRYYRRLDTHPSHLAVALTDNSQDLRRLLRTHPVDLMFAYDPD